MVKSSCRYAHIAFGVRKNKILFIAYSFTIGAKGRFRLSGHIYYSTNRKEKYEFLSLFCPLDVKYYTTFLDNVYNYSEKVNSVQSKVAK